MRYRYKTRGLPFPRKQPEKQPVDEHYNSPEEQEPFDLTLGVGIHSPGDWLRSRPPDRFEDRMRRIPCPGSWLETLHPHFGDELLDDEDGEF